MLASIPVYENSRSFHDHDQMADLVDHTADGRRIFALDHLLHAAEAEPANRLRACPAGSR